ncbi:MAG TPA: hypothetical protein VNE62_11655 [Actinomycetota bacterium]|nr:hypothetical protein [Actinomycetota bacterium]
MRRTITALAVVLAAAVLPPPASASHGPNLDAMDDYLIALVNQGRDDPVQNPSGARWGLALHMGLAPKARQHSRYMINTGRLSNDNLAVRVSTTDPDPFEANGPPDDGFTASYCENVAKTSRIPSGVRIDRRIVEDVYAAWRDSPGHRACMFDETASGYSVTGAGFQEQTFADGDYAMWVTLTVVKDTTPGDYVPYPPPSPTASPSPSPTPTVTPAPTPTVTPTPTLTPDPTPTSTSQPSPTLTPAPSPSASPTPRPVCFRVLGLRVCI